VVASSTSTPYLVGILQSGALTHDRDRRQAVVVENALCGRRRQVVQSGPHEVDLLRLAFNESKACCTWLKLVRTSLD
jgi:hypothetical protein